MSREFENILALDTAMSGCSVCVLKGDQAFVVSEEMPRGQAVRLVPMVNEVIVKAGLTHADLQAILTTSGPGAFTGLRIGLSTAKAMGLALSIPVFGITTLQALALSYAPEAKQSFTVLVETRREEFYVQQFDTSGQAVSHAALARAEDIEAEGVFIGDGTQRFQTLVPDAQIIEGYELPDVKVIAQVLRKTPSVMSENPQAVYLRGADVSVSKRKQRTMA